MYKKICYDNCIPEDYNKSREKNENSNNVRECYQSEDSMRSSFVHLL